MGKRYRARRRVPVERWPAQIDSQLRDDLDGFDGVQVVLPMTCTFDGREHAVTEFEFVRSGGTGRYRAICGGLVIPGSLAEPPGRPCPTCLARLRPAVERARTRSAAALLQPAAALLRSAARHLLGGTASKPSDLDTPTAAIRPT